MVERRAYQRLLFSVEIDYQVLPQSPDQGISKTNSKDISAGGIRLVILEKIKPGRLLDLKFLLPGSALPICATGKVAWIEAFSIGSIDSSDAYDAGIEFIDIDPGDKEKIHLFVRSTL